MLIYNGYIDKAWNSENNKPLTAQAVIFLNNIRNIFI